MLDRSITLLLFFYYFDGDYLVKLKILLLVLLTLLMVDLRILKSIAFEFSIFEGISKYSSRLELLFSLLDVKLPSLTGPSCVGSEEFALFPGTRGRVREGGRKYFWSWLILETGSLFLMVVRKFFFL